MHGTHLLISVVMYKNKPEAKVKGTQSSSYNMSNISALWRTKNLVGETG